MNTKRSIVNLGKTYNDCVIEVTLSHLKNISQNYRKLPRNKTLGWAVLGMWHRQPYHLCCLVHVGIIKLWGICLQLLFLLHIKTNCELQQVLCGEYVTQNFFFLKTLLVLFHSLAQFTCLEHAIGKAARWILMHRLCVWHWWSLKEFLHFVNLQSKGNKEIMGSAH